MKTSFVKGVEQFRKVLNTVEDFMTIVISVILVVIVFLQVFFRYALNSPLAWSEEFARFTFVWLVFISSAVVTRDDSHMSMNFFVLLMPEKLRAVVDVVSKVIISLFMVIIMHQTLNIMEVTASQESPSLHIPMSLIYFSLFVGFALMLVDYATRIILKRREGDK
ncbi:MAG: TRAP transporter small permease [Spirochaetia bacterium]|nr:TRAP transporter small permease [Spirochaetia bacterium]